MLSHDTSSRCYLTMPFHNAVRMRHLDNVVRPSVIAPHHQHDEVGRGQRDALFFGDGGEVTEAAPVEEQSGGDARRIGWSESAPPSRATIPSPLPRELCAIDAAGAVAVLLVATAAVTAATAAGATAPRESST